MYFAKSILATLLVGSLFIGTSSALNVDLSADVLRDVNLGLDVELLNDVNLNGSTLPHLPRLIGGALRDILVRPPPDATIMPVPGPPDVTIMPVPNPPDATIMPVPNPDATIMPVPNPDATIMPVPKPDATIMPVPNPDATIMPVPNPDATIMPVPNPDATIMPVPGPPDNTIMPVPNPPDNTIMPVPNPPDATIMPVPNPPDATIMPVPNPPDATIMPVPNPPEFVLFSGINIHRSQHAPGEEGEVSFHFPPNVDIESGQSFVITLPGKYVFPPTCESQTVGENDEYNVSQLAVTTESSGFGIVFNVPHGEDRNSKVIALANKFANVLCVGVRNPEDVHDTTAFIPSSLRATDGSVVASSIAGHIEGLIMPLLRGSVSQTSTYINFASRTTLRTVATRILQKKDSVVVYYPATYNPRMTGLRVIAVSPTGTKTSIGFAALPRAQEENISENGQTSRRFRLQVDLEKNTPENTVAYEILVNNVYNPSRAMSGQVAYVEFLRQGTVPEVVARSSFALPKTRAMSMATRGTQVFVEQPDNLMIVNVGVEFDKYRNTLTPRTEHLVMALPPLLLPTPETFCEVRQGDRLATGTTSTRRNAATGQMEIVFRADKYIYLSATKKTTFWCRNFAPPAQPIRDGELRVFHEFRGTGVVLASEEFSLPFIGEHEDVVPPCDYFEDDCYDF